jgi:transposase InsO family protein
MPERKLFLNVPEARYVLDKWREEFGQHRPHGGLQGQTPAAFAATLEDHGQGRPLRPTQQSH